VWRGEVYMVAPRELRQGTEREIRFFDSTLGKQAGRVWHLKL